MSCETNPSKQAVSIAAAAAKIDKAIGNVVSATDSSRTPAENMEQSEIRSSVVLIDKISNWYQRGDSRWRSFLRAPGQGKFQLWRFKQNLKQIPQCTQEDTMEIKAFLDGLKSMIDNIYQKDEIEDSVDKVKSQDIPKGATQQGSFMETGPFIDGLHSLWYKISNWKIPQTAQKQIGASEWPENILCNMQW